MLAAHGAVVVDADVLAREAVAPGTPRHAAVVAEFGDEVLAADGSIDRARLGEIVFADTARREALEAIVHPYVARRTAELVAAAPADAVVVCDVPLLVEMQRRKTYDLVVVVDASEEVRIARLKEARGMSGAEIRARTAVQASRDQRLEAADLVVTNDGSRAELKASVDDLWTRIAQV